jgi:hypothetical protein
LARENGAPDRAAKHAEADAMDRKERSRMRMGADLASSGGMKMFQVEHIVTGKTYTVYGQNGMYFLVWDQKTSCWTWILMGECAPVAEESCDAQLPF